MLSNQIFIVVAVIVHALFIPISGWRHWQQAKLSQYHRHLTHNNKALYLLSNENVTARSYDPRAYGGDPTGNKDSTSAVQRCIDLLWEEAGHTTTGTGPQALDLGGAVVDLAGGKFLISNPLTFPKYGGKSFQIRDGTLLASNTFPMDRYLVEMNCSNATNEPYVEGVIFSNMVFDGGEGQRGGGVFSQLNIHVQVVTCWFLRFGTTGFNALVGHELYIDESYFSQDVFGCPEGNKGNGTGIVLDQADASVVNSVILCTKLGIHVNGGNTILENIHIYSSGHYKYGLNQENPIFPFGAVWAHYSRGLKIISCYFDDTIVVLDNPTDVVVANSNWLVGMWNYEACVILRPIQPRGTDPPKLQGLHITNSYIKSAPSYNKSMTSGKQFVYLDEMQGKFDNSSVTDVDISGNIFSLPGITNYRRFSTKTTMSKTVEPSTTNVTFDFSSTFVFPSLMNNIQCTVVWLQAPSSGIKSPEHSVFRVPNTLQVVVVFSAPSDASAQVTVFADQSSKATLAL
eukprot:m.228217 g.228217  ORF g.228217 m.228217 type:complete len:514 (+) comp15976_c1_seq20:160-1701(+)